MFSGRDAGENKLNRPLLYRAIVPPSWIRKDPLPEESIADTMKAVTELTLQKEDEAIRITFHTFPISSEIPRIPPQAQVARWKGQFDQLNPADTYTEVETHGGFSGLFFEATGPINNRPTTVLGWSMQLAPVYVRLLGRGKRELDLQQKADYTIKASGPPSLMKMHRDEIVAFAQSFELIIALPPP